MSLINTTIAQRLPLYRLPKKSYVRQAGEGISLLLFSLRVLLSLFFYDYVDIAFLAAFFSFFSLNTLS